MCQYLKPISISLSPNTEKDDVLLALKLIFQPWKWEQGKAVLELEERFKNYLSVKHAISFNSGRSGLMAILRSLGLKPGSEVLLQAFTCVAAVDPILWSRLRLRASARQAGLKPVYVDCDKDTFNIDIGDLERKISSNSRVLMIQHTFGLPANMDGIIALAKRYNLILIEDCAHALGAEVNGKKVGTFGKASFFSFSRDKNISSVYGGVVVTDDDELAAKIRKVYWDVGRPNNYWVFQQLLHPVLMNWVILPLYNVLDLGKIFLVLSQWFGILSKAVHWKEKIGKKPSYFPKRYPNALAILALNQFKKIDRFYSHRKELSRFYYNSLKDTSFEISEDLSPESLDARNIKHGFLRFTIKHPKAHEIIYEAWHKKNIIVGDWYVSPIIPYDTNLESIGYKMGSCPTAEKLSKTTLNLPTHINISKKDAEKIVKFLEQWK
ncbi:DegT/DnrJ/EryC1/StrS family aminotransferase [Patescibacteria group bacterium]|nr:DegT/DnrJ/EryC1/StrS family aminotransferase [Patescibacteria group bacterium]